jgi:hypothetical protein
LGLVGVVVSLGAMTTVMTTAIIGTGGIGSVIARQLASGGETLRLSSADKNSARRLAAEIGPAGHGVRKPVGRSAQIR